MLEKDLKLSLPFLEDAPNGFFEELSAYSAVKRFTKNTKLLQEEDSCQYLPIVLSGSIRIFKINQNAKELTLYHVTKGETCFLSASCIFRSLKFPAVAEAEEYTEALMVQASAMKRWLEKYPFWQKFIFEMASNRLVDIIESIADMTFTKLDTRIASYFIKLYKKHGNALNVTHQEIANELGSAREVITRTLKLFEKEKIISLSRGSIKINNFTALENLVKDSKE